MIPTRHFLVLFVLAGSSYAVFYTKSTDNEYPRIGRRAFYTSGNGYPRIGRRDDGSFGDFEFEKRGLYTSGGGYPRVGRSDGGMSSDLWEQSKSNLFRNIAALRRDVGESTDADSHVIGDRSTLKDSSDVQGDVYGLDLLFVAFDENGDNQLSKAEFSRGMEKYRQKNPLC